jgi:hypothetical protein
MSIEYVMEDGWDEWVDEVETKKQMVKEAELWAEREGRRATMMDGLPCET